MAHYSAIAATSQGIVELLSAAAANTPFSTASFSVASSADLHKAPGDNPSASVYLYRVAINTARRNLSPRRNAQGRLLRPAVPVDLHYLLTAWSKNAVMQHRLLGWCIRIFQDTPTLGAGFLNQFGPDPEVFRPEETVELIWETLTPQEMTDAWEVAKGNQQPSASYVARIIEIESDVVVDEGPPVQTRDMRYQQVAS